ncbi:MAG: hypothetical protein ACFCD0_07250 [Gemmataceae bacterium]
MQPVTPESGRLELELVESPRFSHFPIVMLTTRLRFSEMMEPDRAFHACIGYRFFVFKVLRHACGENAPNPSEAGNAASEAGNAASEAGNAASEAGNAAGEGGLGLRTLATSSCTQHER